MGKKEGQKKRMTVEEAGRKGGKKTAQTHGKEFYREIGRKGGEAVAAEKGPAFYREIGRKGGGKVAEEKGPELFSRIGRKGGESRASKTKAPGTRSGNVRSRTDEECRKHGKMTREEVRNGEQTTRGEGRRK